MQENKGLMIAGILGVLLIGAFLFLGNGSEETPADTTQNAMEVENSMMENDTEDSDSMMEEGMMPKENIVEIASANEDFSTLVTAVTEAGLVETLSGPGPFTVFAPTDAAFEALPEGTLEAVLADKEQLTSILTYHVVPGKVMAEDVVELDSATTVQGQDLTIEVVDGEVMVNNAKVVMTDIEASNGVIHVIDTVLLPQ